MKVFQEAGLPDGVINFLPGSGALIGDICLTHSQFSGVHFTGSNNTFNHIWKTVSDHLNQLSTYPRLVGETGGKDFIFVHDSSDPDEVATGIIRGAFEYQGQKCSAASRVYLPRSLWSAIRDKMGSMLSEIKLGDVRDFFCFVNAVIDSGSFENIMRYIHLAESSPEAEIIFGGKGDQTVGYYIQPTVILTTNPHFITMEEEIFGPVVTIYLYEDDKFEETLELCDQTSPYALTGAVFSRDRYAFVKACQKLRYAAGNFYLNDKPTGAMVGMQPFGGARGSGTNDKAGGPLNLMRWISPRTIKETFSPATHFAYPFMQQEDN
jgi:1-pyrroline-5-carboxylate dehydrogenase